MNVIFHLFIFNTFTDISKILFSLCRYEVRCVDQLGKTMNLNNCSIRLQHNTIEKNDGDLNTL